LWSSRTLSLYFNLLSPIQIPMRRVKFEKYNQLYTVTFLISPSEAGRSEHLVCAGSNNSLFDYVILLSPCRGITNNILHCAGFKIFCHVFFLFFINFFIHFLFNITVCVKLKTRSMFWQTKQTKQDCPTQYGNYSYFQKVIYHRVCSCPLSRHVSVEMLYFFISVKMELKGKFLLIPAVGSRLFIYDWIIRFQVWVSTRTSSNFLYSVWHESQNIYDNLFKLLFWSIKNKLVNPHCLLYAYADWTKYHHLSKCDVMDSHAFLKAWHLLFHIGYKPNGAICSTGKLWY